MNQPESPSDSRYTEADLKDAENRVAHAREAAGRSALSAAKSLEESARAHDEVAGIEESAVNRDRHEIDRLRRSAKQHHAFAAEDRDLAEKKRKEANEIFGA
ncbi:hypothetical protein [Mycobacterium asiaticum]|uniref:Uncharacterized protein n=1 Tax=Mycobacterium asiaticum TaxID=1790 RepID=A0A1A3CHF2_MYCAS|nr:hypothetical protein [Mycobacterium asiaticum]OBI86449.1 hypothetical protein A9X01_17010 [Mycobacterium asiaticum]